MTDQEARDHYERRAKDLIKEIRKEKNISYKDLARRLEGHGVTIDAQVLINRVNAGKFSFSFALQLLAAMGVSTLDIPDYKPEKSGNSRQ